MVNPFTVFARAGQYLPLTPAERAFLKLAESAVLAALVTALPVVAQYLDGKAIDWTSVARLAVGTFGVAFLAALVKYAKAQGDPVVGGQTAALLAQTAESAVAKATGVDAATVTASVPAVTPDAQQLAQAIVNGAMASVANTATPATVTVNPPVTNTSTPVPPAA